MMDRLSLKAQERIILGKQVKKLRRDGIIPAHVFGNKIATSHISVKEAEFSKIYSTAGETGLIDLKVGQGGVKPVMVRDAQYDPVTEKLLHIDFYQVNLSEKVKVYVPIELVGEEVESVHLGEAVVLQILNEIEMEALPADLIDKIEVDITPLKNINDAITAHDLNYDRSKLTILADPEEVVVKLAPAITEEMQRLLDEQEAEAQAAKEAAAVVGEEVVAEVSEGEVVVGVEEAALEVEQGEVVGQSETTDSAKPEGGEELNDRQ